MPGISKIISLSILLITFSISGLQAQEGEVYYHFQTIPSNGYGVFSIAQDEDLLAINYNNKRIHLFILNASHDRYIPTDTFDIRKINIRYGEMKIHKGKIYVDINGHKYYEIDPVKKSIEKTNTYRAGFFIMERQYIGLRTKDWEFELDDNMDLKVSRRFYVF